MFLFRGNERRNEIETAREARERDLYVYECNFVGHTDTDTATATETDITHEQISGGSLG